MSREGALVYRHTVVASQRFMSSSVVAMAEGLLWSAPHFSWAVAQHTQKSVYAIPRQRSGMDEQCGMAHTSILPQERRGDAHEWQTCLLDEAEQS